MQPNDPQPTGSNGDWMEHKLLVTSTLTRLEKKMDALTHEVDGLKLKVAAIAAVASFLGWALPTVAAWFGH